MRTTSFPKGPAPHLLVWATVFAGLIRTSLTFDVIFRAPRFDARGKKIANARFMKVAHNGKVIHENVELTGPTRGPLSEGEPATGPLLLQGDHGPLAYRNLWVKPVESK